MKNIYFLAPQVEGGTYYYYKEISDYLIKNYSDTYNVHFCNSLRDYIKLHFIKTDIIFSIVPFFFKPIGTKKYFFNPHGNYKIDRKSRRLGVKLLYLAELNIWFCDKILLTSLYLADKLNFREKYENKIEILPNFVPEIKQKNQQLEENDLNFLTITSFKFYDKGKGIINLGNVIRQIGNHYSDKAIHFTIIGSESNANFLYIKSQFDRINFPGNINIHFKGWLKKQDLESEFLSHNTFLYWTYLDNTPGVILDAINYNLKVFTNNFEGFKYFLDENIICKNEDEMLEKITKKDYKDETKVYTIKEVCDIIRSLMG